MVERMETASDSDLDLYRASLRELFASIKVVADEWEVRFEADFRETQAALLRAAGGSANNVVAGGRFELKRMETRPPHGSIVVHTVQLCLDLLDRW